MVTSEDEVMVRSIERVLGSKIERRQVDGFDYAVPAPKKDVEFARPPREPQRRREKPAAAKPSDKGGRPAGRPAKQGERPAQAARPAGEQPAPRAASQPLAGKHAVPGSKGAQRPPQHPARRGGGR